MIYKNLDPNVLFLISNRKKSIFFFLLRKLNHKRCTLSGTAYVLYNNIYIIT